MKLIDWHSTDPTPRQQIRVLLGYVPRVVVVHVAWAGEEAAWFVQNLVGSIHAGLRRLLGLPDHRDRVVYHVDPTALRHAQEVDA